MRTTRTMQLAAGAALCATGAATAQVRYDNGPLLTSPNICTAPPVGMISETQLSNTTTGFLANRDFEARLADDFTIGDLNGWNVTGFVFYSYQNGQGPTGNQFNYVSIRVWSGRPGLPGSTIVFGDPVTNRFTSFIFANVYRVYRGGIQCSTDRAVCAITCTIPPLTLPQGTYWVDWNIGSSSTLSGPWVPPVTISGLAAKPGANAVGFVPASGSWMQVADSFSGAVQDLPFQVLGTIVGPSGCYANCDHSTTPPFLNVNDFSCFLNKFAAGDTYANCDGSTTPPVLNINDFVCFLNAFSAGCSAP
jgi:hypothetical protein